MGKLLNRSYKMSRLIRFNMYEKQETPIDPYKNKCDMQLLVMRYLYQGDTRGNQKYRDISLSKLKWRREVD